MFEEIVSKLTDNPNKIVAKKHGKRQEVVLGELLTVILSTSTTQEIADYYNTSTSTIRRLMSSLYPEAKVTGSNWKYFLLRKTGKKQCARCGQIKDPEEFSKDVGQKDGKYPYCKPCTIGYHEDKQYETRWANQPQEERNFYNAQYRAAKLKATPAWTNAEEIKKIYLDCPKGHEVDHIIPLRGEFVCGLHVAENLQYLTITENRRKSNKHG